jgi:hypothetical protein
MLPDITCEHIQQDKIYAGLDESLSLAFPLLNPPLAFALAGRKAVLNGQ